MKRIFLFLAATAVLASSCMKENAFENLDGKVTVKAVASDTKTLVDGTSVVWENDDTISVVVVADYKYAYNFDAETVNGAAADFVGTIGQSEYNEAYAVYPASAVNVNNTKWVTHTLAETQTGVVTSGMNLSSALLDADALKNGGATATFKNALTLLQVTVPSGVASVALTSSMVDASSLVGTASFSMNADGTLQLSSRLTERRTVTLSTGSELEAGTYSLLVYPGNYSSLTLTMTGTDGAVYESAISATFEAGEYRPINLTEIFKMKTEEEMFISPAGGECEVKIASVADYTYEVSITDNTGNWLSFTLPVTKGFHQDVITFSAEENTTGADRTANVTITWGENQTRTFDITQKSVFMDFVNDENGDPIQWEETFGLYSDESLNSKLATFTNVFTIELSDDFSKGTYKLKNLFVVDMYYGEGYQMITNKGGDYYANYDATTGNLTVLKANAVASYTFPGDVVLTYDSVNKTFSATTLTVTLLPGSAYYASATRYIGGYSAAVKEESPEAPSSPYAYLFGDYKETFDDSMYAGYPSKGILTIAQSDDANYDLKMTFFGGKSAAVTTYANVSDDGKKITTVQTSCSMGTFYPSTLDIEYLSMGSPIWGTLNFDYPTITDYTAAKQ